MVVCSWSANHNAVGWLGGNSMSSVWRCFKANHVLEIDGEFQPNCRIEKQYIGSTCCDKLYMEEELILHCVACEQVNECKVCNDEKGRLVYEESF